MNKERYLKLKKDFIVLYLARNGIMTFLITLFTFSLDYRIIIKYPFQQQYHTSFLIIFLH